ncbi:hypothetical protein ACE4RV_11650 [Acetobacter persici]|uniref:hypothetical protein n=1 Tax=Acetobacter persici TaxID=1076596 RepID=UPI0036DED014
MKRSVALYGIANQKCVSHVPERSAYVTRQYDSPFEDGVIGVIPREAFADREIQKAV